MCMQTTGVRPWQKWHWAGDEIVPSTIPATRRLPEARKKDEKYRIDLREFLSIEHNAIVKKFLFERVIDTIPACAERERFWRNEPGNFDFRVRQIAFAFESLQYLKGSRKFESWCFPEETVARNGGDCEDLAFLMAALMEEAGISPDCIRVALGVVADHRRPNLRPHDHAWVMYQSEKGIWRIVDPLAWIGREKIEGRPRRGSRPVADMEYIPAYVANRNHLWKVRAPEAHDRNGDFIKYLDNRKFWDKFNPEFAAGVHAGIYDHVFKPDMKTIDRLLVKSYSLWVDVNTLAYDPRDHFDFSYINEGWERVGKRLESGDLRDFALAVHAIGDFYAHSLYSYIVSPNGETIPICDPKNLPQVGKKLDFLFTDPKFAPKDAPLSQEMAREEWSGKLLSGQWWRGYSSYPDELQGEKELNRRRSLPDHDLLAVDRKSGGGGSHLYDTNDYKIQFDLRRDAAQRHVAAVWKDWKAKFYD